MLLHGRPIGALDLRRLPGELRLNRILLLPEHQGAGLGSELMRRILAEADAGGLPVRLQVLKVNPAQRLYERLGFRAVGETHTHVRMERVVG